MRESFQARESFLKKIGSPSAVFKTIYVYEDMPTRDDTKTKSRRSHVAAEPQSAIVGPCRHKPISERCPSCILDSSDFFADVATSAKLALQQFLKFKSIERGQMLYTQGEAARYLYILISGQIKVYKSLPEGRQPIHRLFTIPGDLMACEDLFLDRHNSTAEAIVATAVCVLDRRGLYNLLHEQQKIHDTLLRAMARNLNAYISHISHLGRKSAIERVASYLVFMADTHVETLRRDKLLAHSLTRVELAEMLGVTPRTLIRSLRSLEAQRVIALARGGFVILDMPALTRIAG